MTAGPAAIGSCGTCGAVLGPDVDRCTRCEAPMAGPRPTPSALSTTLVRATSSDRTLTVGVDVGLLVLATAPLVLGAVGVWPPAVAVPFGLVLTVGVTVLLVREFRRTGGTPGAVLARTRYVDALLGTPPGPGNRRGAHVELVRLAQHRQLAPPPVAQPSPAPAPAPATQPAPGLQPARTAQAPQAPRAPSPRAQVAVLTDGAERIEVASTVLLGRRPRPRPDEEVGAVVHLTDPTRSVSSTHALVSWDGTTLWLVDRGSTNGSWVVEPDGARQRAEAGQPLAAPADGAVQLGNRTFRVAVT